MRPRDVRKNILQISIVIISILILLVYGRRADQAVEHNEKVNAQTEQLAQSLTDIIEQSVVFWAKIAADSDNRREEDTFVMEFPAVEMEPVPELGWHDDFCMEKGYVCWGDMLAINNVIYRKEGEIYRRTGQKVQELFGVTDEWYPEKIVQDESLLITWNRFPQNKSSGEFMIYDMETQKTAQYSPCDDILTWYVYEGKIYYTETGRRNAVFRMDPRTGKREELCTWDYDSTVQKFMIRDDGALMAEVEDDGIRGYWLIYPDQSGKYLGIKIWENNEYEFTTFAGFNERGLFLYGEYYDYRSGSLLCLKDSGEADILDRAEDMRGDFLIAEYGYYRWDSVDSVSYYDYRGNERAAYGLIDDRWLDAGYRLENIIYHKGEILAFYSGEDREELYIGKVELWTDAVTEKNEEIFERAVKKLGLSEAEAVEYWRILYEDDVFQGGTGQLTAFSAGDFDNNGQKDMAIMIHQDPYGCYGTGSIYIYMNDDEPYRFRDDEFPFYSSGFNEMHISGGDLDNDGIIEIVIEASGTGNGGAGDWQGRILKYRDHSLEKTQMLPKGEIEIQARVMKELEENTYSVCFPDLGAGTAFKAQEVFHYDGKEARWVGANMRGLFDMHCILYQGGYAMQASEFLYGEGGNSHIVATVEFIITWDENGNGHVVEWWIEGENLSLNISMESGIFLGESLY